MHVSRASRLLAALFAGVACLATLAGTSSTATAQTPPADSNSKYTFGSGPGPIFAAAHKAQSE